MDLCRDCGAKVDRVVKLWSLKERPSAPSISFLRLRRQSAGVSVSANACPVMSTGPRRFHPPIQMHIDGHRWTMKLRISCFRFFLTHPDQHFPQIHQLLVFWRDTFLDRFGLTKVRVCTVNMDWRGKTSPWCTMAAFLQRCFIFEDSIGWFGWLSTQRTQIGCRWPFTFDLQAADPCFMIHRLFCIEFVSQKKSVRHHCPKEEFQRGTEGSQRDLGTSWKLTGILDLHDW